MGLVEVVFVGSQPPHRVLEAVSCTRKLVVLMLTEPDLLQSQEEVSVPTPIEICLGAIRGDPGYMDMLFGRRYPFKIRIFLPAGIRLIEIRLLFGLNHPFFE